MSEIYEFHCERHDARAYAPREGGNLDWDRPCDCAGDYDDYSRIRVTRIVDGERRDSWLIADIEGPPPAKRWMPGVPA